MGGEGGRALWLARTDALELERGPLPLGVTRAFYSAPLPVLATPALPYSEGFGQPSCMDEETKLAI